MTASPPTADDALALLQAGNARFVACVRSREALATPTKRADLASGQHPHAIILGCSDSRVPAEMVFDQGLGDLFVIRVAGNIVAPSQIGSVEFAAAKFGTKLAVVLGHTLCGAVMATVDAVLGEGEPRSDGVRSIVDRVRPAIEPLAAGQRLDREALIREGCRANIRASANHLRHGSALIERLSATDGFRVVGAEYCLESGAVDFFDVA